MSYELTLLIAAHLATSSIIPIYNKELFMRFPYPVYSTLAQIALGIPISFLVAWKANKFATPKEWAVPSKRSRLILVISSLAYAGMLLFGNLGFHVSDIDFAVLFRISTIVSNALCGFFILGEKINLLGCIGILTVACGLSLLASNFQWSTYRLPSASQIWIQAFAVISSSLSSLTLKLTIKQLDASGFCGDPFTILFWRYSIACLPVFVSSLWIEPSVYINFAYVHSARTALWIALGVLLSEVFQALITVLHEYTSMISLSVITQMKFIPTLLISNFFYKKTRWSLKQIIGTILLGAGATIYTLSRVQKGENKSDELRLTSNADEESSQSKEILV